MAKMGPITLASPFANPFGPQVGQPLDDNQVDVGDINTEAFEACQRLVSDVSAGGFSAALTVFGDSGTGKTHLVGRVRRWLEKQPNNLFAFVRMETSPAGIWRHLRRHLALALLRKNSDGVRAINVLLAQREKDPEAFVDRDLSLVLEYLAAGQQVRDSAAWLCGEGLPEDVLHLLHLSTPKLEDDPEVISRQLVISICELMRPGVVVFCMDQIEAAMSSPGDRDGPHAVGKVVSCLVEETRNAAVICCEQSMFMNVMEQILDNSAKSKMMGRRAAIRPLSWEQAKSLMRARLDTLPGLRAERAARGGSWPLAEKRVLEVFTDNAAPARSVIQRCKDLFDEWQFGQLPARESADAALQRMLDERISTKSPAETEAILRNGMPLIARAVGLECKVLPKPAALDFSIDDNRVAVAICNEENATALANHLKKISQAWKPGQKRSLVVLRDARFPIGANAKVTKQRIKDLQGQSGRLVMVSQEAAEALAALRRLLSDSQSGDLAYQNGESVTASAVEQWIAGHLPEALDPLVSELGGKAAGGLDLSPALADLLAEKKMMTVEDAARSLEVTIAEVEETARRDPRLFGLLGGSVPALFEPVTGRQTGSRPS